MREAVHAGQAAPWTTVCLAVCGVSSPCAWAVQAGQAVPEVLRTLALRALAVQLMDRTRHSSVIANISIGGQSGLLSQLMHSAVRLLLHRQTKRIRGRPLSSATEW